jgi:hypothetical protein
MIAKFKWKKIQGLSTTLFKVQNPRGMAKSSDRLVCDPGKSSLKRETTSVMHVASRDHLRAKSVYRKSKCVWLRVQRHGKSLVDFHNPAIVWFEVKSQEMAVQSPFLPQTKQAPSPPVSTRQKAKCRIYVSFYTLSCAVLTEHFHW